MTDGNNMPIDQCQYGDIARCERCGEPTVELRDRHGSYCGEHCTQCAYNDAMKLKEVSHRLAFKEKRLDWLETAWTLVDDSDPLLARSIETTLAKKKQ